MADVVAIVSISVSTFILLVGCILFVVRFSVASDPAGIVPKIIVIVGMLLSFFVVIVVPFDESSFSVDGLGEKYFQYAILLSIIFYSFVIVPYCLSFFGTILIESSENIFQRCLNSCIGPFISLSLYFLITVPLFYRHNEKGLDFPLYMIATYTFLAWFPFSVFLGVGIVQLPISLLLEFIGRPTKKTKDELADKRENLGKKARELRKKGEFLKKKLIESKTDRETKSLRKQFEETVNLVNVNYDNIVICTEMSGGNPLQFYMKLVMSGICGLLSLLQIVHIIAYVFPKNGQPFLNYVLINVKIGNFEFFSLIFFVIFIFYLYQVAVYGMFKIGSYIPFMTALYPLKYRNTTTDSFLVNSIVILSASLPTIHFSTVAFSEYLTGSQIQKMFHNEISETSFFKSFFANNVFIYIFVCLAGISFFVFYCFPPNRNSKIESKLNQLLKIPDDDKNKSDFQFFLT